MLGKKNADELFKLAGALPSLRMRAAPSRVCQARTYTLTCVPDHDGDGEITAAEYDVYQEILTPSSSRPPTAPRRGPRGSSVRRRRPQSVRGVANWSKLRRGAMPGIRE